MGFVDEDDGDLEDFDEGEYLFAYDLYRNNERSENYEESASDDVL